jgi:DNA-directed RNA polymerase specialized sigma subunit
MLIEVTRKEYEEFYRDVERHKYVLSESRRFAHFSINEMAKEDDEIRGIDILPDENVDICAEIERNIEVERLKNALLQLNDYDYKLIRALFFEEVSVRDYAKIVGKHYTSVYDDKNRILKKLRKFLKK